MIYQNYKKHLFYPAFAAILTIILLAVSDTSVKSERAAETKPLPFKFKRFPASKKDTANLISAPTSAGNLESKRTIDFSSNENANAVAVQMDGKIVTAGSVAVADNSYAPNHDFAVFRYNADGSLDTSFDADGKVTTPIGNDLNNYDAAYAVAVQPDGKIIAAGLSSYNTATLVRYNTDGSLDNSFGAGGKVITESGYVAIYEIAVQTDGKIVAAGYITNDGNIFNFALARYNGNGSLDASFGTGGIVTTNFGNQYQIAYSVAVQADGKIVAAGNTDFLCDLKGYCFSDFALARYNPDGSLDTSFDTDGKLTTDFDGGYDIAGAVVVQADGKIIAVGSGGFFNYAVARYNGNGSLDTSFDGDGKVMTGFGDFSYASSVVLQSNGKIVISGETYVGASYDFALVRLNTDGSLDTSFDGDGKVTTDFGNIESAYDVAIQANGKIVAAGAIRDNGGNDDFALSRYTADGSLDAAFDGDGKQTTSLTVVSSAANAVVIDEIRFGGGTGTFFGTYFVGYSGNGANDDFAIARGVGSAITPVGNSDDRANAAAIDSSGRVIAAGYSNNGANSDFALVRYLPTPEIDSSFGANGKVTTDFDGNNDEAKAVAVQADGKIVVVGQTIINGNTVLSLARYNDNGSLDASFGTGGKVILHSIQNPKAMAIQPDGKIIAAGNVANTVFPFGESFALARFNSNGSLDMSFDGDGIAVTHFVNFSSLIKALALQPYGKIVAAGVTHASSGSSEFALARYNADGSLDTTFGAGGKVTTSLNYSSEANAVRVQRNGKIVAVGISFNPTIYNFPDFALARYNGDGSLDTTFDTDGKQTTDFFGDFDGASAAAIQSDGRIIAAGSARRGARYDFAVARYTGDAVQTNVKYDYDGDGLADLSVFRPSNGIWYLNRSTQGFSATPWGISTDKIAPADFDGDGKTDIAVFRDGVWYWLNSSTNSFNAAQFGLPDDIPVPADYTGGFSDGRAELTVYRGGVWWSLNLRNNQTNVVNFGLATDKPVPADYDGDGRADQAVYRGSGEWHLNRSSQGYTVIQFGLPNDKTVPADYDGDGKADLAVYRDGTWYVLQSTNGFTAFQWGISTDVPAPADYDGDGRTDLAVFRDGAWWIRQSTNGIAIQQFGLAGDKPVAAAYLP